MPGLMQKRPRRAFSEQRLKSPQKCGLRSIRRNPVVAYLDLYMLQIKREAYERRNDIVAGRKYQEQLQDVMRQVNQLEDSRPAIKEMRQAIEAGASSTPAKKFRRPVGDRKLKVIDIGY